MSIKKFINKNKNDLFNIIAALIFAFFAILLFESENAIINIIGILYCVLYIIYFFYIFFRDIINEFRNEPFHSFTNCLAILFIVIPIFIDNIINENKSADIIKSFFTISVGIGINYVIDSIFKYVEPRIENEKKKSLIKKGAFTKILFNVIYISEYIAFILVEQKQWSFLEPLKKWKCIDTLFNDINNFSRLAKVLLLTMICFIVLMAFVSVIINSLVKELNNEMPNQTSVIKKDIENKLKIISDIKSIIKNNDDNILNNMENIESKLQDELIKLNNSDS